MTNHYRAMALSSIVVNAADPPIGKVSDERKDIGISSKRLMPFSSYDMGSIESRHPYEQLKNKVDASLKAQAGAVNSADAPVEKVSDEHKNIGIYSKRLMPFSFYDMGSIESRHPREQLKNKVDVIFKAQAGCDDDAR